MPTFAITNNTGTNIDIKDSADKLFPRYHHGIPTGGVTSLTVNDVEAVNFKTQLDALHSTYASLFSYTVTESTGSGVALKFKQLTPANPTATYVHGNILSTSSLAVVTGGITSPDVARNLAVTFGASWDGGNVVVAGTDERGVAISETFVPNLGNAVVGTKCFATVTGVSHTIVGTAQSANTAGIGLAATGTLLGIDLAGPPANSTGFLLVNSTAEAVTISTTTKSFAPTTQPDGSKIFTIFFNV